MTAHRSSPTPKFAACSKIPSDAMAILLVSPAVMPLFRRDSKCLATPCRLGFCGKCEHRWCREAGQKAATVHHALPQGRGLQCRFARREDSRRSRRLLAESPMGGRGKPRCVLHVEPEDHQKID